MALRIPPPILLLLFGGAVYLLDRFFPQGEAFIHYQVQFYTCAFLALIAFALDLPALLSFLSSKTTISPLSPAKATTLVTNGVYGFTRNPMYLSMVLLLLAWIVLSGQLGRFNHVAAIHRLPHQISNYSRRASAYQNFWYPIYRLSKTGKALDLRPFVPISLTIN